MCRQVKGLADKYRERVLKPWAMGSTYLFKLSKRNLQLRDFASLEIPRDGLFSFASCSDSLPFIIYCKYGDILNTVYNQYHFSLLKINSKRMCYSKTSL